jgi:hypothetical protein
MHGVNILQLVHCTRSTHMTSRCFVSDFEISDKFHCLYTCSNAPSNESHRLPQWHLEIRTIRCRDPKNVTSYGSKFASYCQKFSVFLFWSKQNLWVEMPCQPCSHTTLFHKKTHRLRLGPKFEGLSSNSQWDDSTSFATSIHVWATEQTFNGQQWSPLKTDVYLNYM